MASEEKAKLTEDQNALRGQAAEPLKITIDAKSVLRALLSTKHDKRTEVALTSQKSNLQLR